jgi:hypothetical protein
MKICNVERCEKATHSYGYCYIHVYRFKKYGDALTLSYLPKGVCELKCVFDECNDKVIAKGLCSKHYQRWKKNGSMSVIKSKSMHESDIDAYTYSVIKKSDNECWGWSGYINKGNGYAYFCFQGKVISAHRFSYSYFKDFIPESLFVCHSCDQKICTNPDHLFLGTPKDNTHDMIKKGRSTNRIIQQCRSFGTWQQNTD